MTMKSIPGNPPMDELAHFGVKGMRWGVRREQTRARNAEIKGARQRQGDRLRALGKAEDKLDYGSNASPNQKKAQSDFIKKDKEYRYNQDAITARRVTSGEKALSFLLGGPVGLVVLTAGSKAAVASKQRQVRRHG